MEKDNPRFRMGASWAFSIAAHLIILFSAGLWVTQVVLPAKSTNVTLNLPEKEQGVALSSDVVQTASSTITYGARHRIVSDTQFEPRDADYLSTWRRYIESMGTEKYKAALKKNPHMKGELSLRVSIDANGKLANVMVEQSSGSKALDQLALQIVKDAAPFQPLPEEMRKDTDSLDILRTWKFD